LIQARLEVLGRMVDREHDAELKELTAQVEMLKAQNETLTSEVSPLRARVAELEAKADEVRTVTIPDPEAAALREQNEALKNLLKRVASQYSDESERAQAAIRAITSSTPAVARVFCEAVGVDFASYAQMLQTYRTEAQLQEVILRAKQKGPAVVFAQAAIAVRDAYTLASMIQPQDSRTLEEKNAEKLREAKSVVGVVPRPSPMPIVSAEENLRSQPRTSIGSPDSMGFRERITPVSVNTLERPHKAISGCADGAEFSPWV
jgi:regulator of replication initiation timing